MVGLLEVVNAGRDIRPLKCAATLNGGVRLHTQTYLRSLAVNGLRAALPCHFALPLTAERHHEQHLLQNVRWVR